jgi:hypothetical protein
MTADGLSAFSQNGVSHRAHQADFAAAVNQRCRAGHFCTESASLF